MNLIKKILVWIGQLFQFILWHLPISIVALIGVYFSFKLMNDPLLDSISIANYTFAVVAALSALSFAFGATMMEDDMTRKKLQYCGERFLHSVILLIVAAVVQYFLIQKDVNSFGESYIIISKILYFVGFVPGLFYFGSLINVIAALRELNAILFNRKKLGKELSKFF